MLYTQINILERYSQIAPVTDNRWVILNEMNRPPGDEMKGYNIEKKYQKYVRDQNDLKMIRENLKTHYGAEKHLAQYKAGNPPMLEHLLELHEQFIQAASPTGSRDEA